MILHDIPNSQELNTSDNPEILYRSMKKILPMWEHNSFKEKQELLPQLLNIVLSFKPMQESWSDKKENWTGDLMSTLVLNRFIPFDCNILFKDFFLDVTVKNYINRQFKPEHLIEQHINASAQYEKEKIESCLNEKPITTKKVKI